MKKSSAPLLAVLVTILLMGVPLAFLLNSEKLSNRDLAYENSRLTAELAAAEEARSSQEGEMLFYDLNGLDVTAASKEVTFTDLLTLEDLTSRAEECETVVEANHFEDLIAKFSEVKGMQYSFTSNTDPEEVFEVTVFPNVPEYKDLAAFRADYPACSVGLVNAASMNQSKLMFTSACGAGYAESPTLACADIQKGLVLEFN